jgi:hypothetical protein
MSLQLNHQDLCSVTWNSAFLALNTSLKYTSFCHCTGVNFV